eukprot:scaffold953_cov141-Cylindrotheca_fusiformis.AAC.1
MVAIPKATQTSGAIFWGSSIASPVFVEVVPLILDASSRQPPSLSNFGCKSFLQSLTKRTGVSIRKNDNQELVMIEWDRDGHDGSENRLDCGYLFQTDKPRKRCVFPGRSRVLPIFYLSSEDPTVSELQPCCIRAYAHSRRGQNTTTAKVIVSNSCLVRVLPPTVAYLCLFNAQSNRWDADSSKSTPDWFSRQLFLESLQSELGNDFLSDSFQSEVERNHNRDTIQQLTIRFSLLLSKPVIITTTADTSQQRMEQKSERDMMRLAIRAHFERIQVPLKAGISTLDTSIHTAAPETNPLHWEPSLIIHSPNHADGKTLLAQSVAKRVGCSKIHIIRPGPLMAKYGISADAALESLLHSLIVSAAVTGSKICIILDQLDAMMPPRLSARSGSGDAAVPVFNAVGSYLRKVTGSLKAFQEWPFPVRVCLIAIVTCPNDGWKSSQRDAGESSSILDSLVGGKYRIQPLTAETRLRAFSGIFQERNIHLESSASAKLPLAAASAAWAKGSAFARVASNIARLSAKGIGMDIVATAADLELAMSKVKADCTDFAQVSFQTNDDDNDATKTRTGGPFFESVGGNTAAKGALEDALALDPNMRKMLARFGLTSPVGIMLYGPPGCGKTLLAKAVASLLKTPSRNNNALALGGTFISLSSSDIVRAEVGTSEKLVVSAFEFADKNAPSVIFLDEFQALFTERSRGGSSKLATTLLGCLDDIRRWQNVDNYVAASGSKEGKTPEDGDWQGSNRVIVLAATNTPWMVDSAFLRPGRFDRVVHVGLPTISERESILSVHLCHMQICGGDAAGKRLCARLANKTAGFSGADLAALCRGAAIRTLMDNTPEVEESHFLQALTHDVRASSNDELVRRLMAWRP